MLTGLGTIYPSEKLSIQSVSNKTELGIYGFTAQTAPYLFLQNSAGTKIWYWYSDRIIPGITGTGYIGDASHYLSKAYVTDVHSTTIDNTAAGKSYTWEVTDATSLDGNLIGNPLICGTATFTTTSNVAYKAITGATAADKWVASPIFSSTTTLPTSGDVIGCVPSSGGVYFVRVSGSGGTSGLVFDYIHVK